MHFELTVKNIEYISEIHNILESQNITHISLTDKNGLPSGLDVAKELWSLNSNYDFTVTYSFKNHTSKDPQQILDTFTGFLEESQSLGVKKILLVSGEPKPKFDTLKGLEMIRETSNIIQSGTKLYCAFNPYILNPDFLEKEKLRLQEKIATGLISGVYLQIGSDVTRIPPAVEYIRSLKKDLEIYGGVVVPNQRFLQNFQFRPWRGVVLNEEYLVNLDIAMVATSEILNTFEAHNIIPNITVLPFNTKSIEEFKQKYL
jgi:hypothetical protein